MCRRHFVAVFLLLFFVFDVQNVSARNIPGIESLSLQPGCHQFYGKIECQNGQKILPSAKISLMEFDQFSIIDDKISTAEIDDERGYYKISGCTNGILGYANLFFEFENACFDGQRFQVSYPKPDTFESHVIGDDEEDNIGNGAEILNDDKNQVPDSNHPVPRFQPLRSQYPPMPRPHDRRRRQQQQKNDLMNEKRYKRSFKCGTLQVNSGARVSFYGIVKCYDKKAGKYIPPRKDAIVKLVERDYAGNDVLATAKVLYNGTYKLSGIAKDVWMAVGYDAKRAEIMVRYENVCFYGDSYENFCPIIFSTEDVAVSNFPPEIRFVNPKDDPDFYVKSKNV